MANTRIKPEEIKLLRTFYENADSLGEHSLIKNKKLKVKTSISWHKGSSPKISRHEIDEELFESLLVRLRRLCNPKDEIFLLRIINIFLNYETQQEDRDALRKLKRMFEVSPEYRLLNLNRGAKKYAEKDVFNLYLNGRIFHTDEEKQALLKELSSGKFSPVNDMFTSAVVTKTNAILVALMYMRQKGISNFIS